MIDRNALPPAVIDALRRGDKIAAVKLLREATRIGLAEAKGAIDALEAAKSGRPAPAAPASAAKPAQRVALRHGPRRPREDDLGPGEEPHSSASAAATVMLLAAVALVVWYFLSR